MTIHSETIQKLLDLWTMCEKDRQESRKFKYPLVDNDIDQYFKLDFSDFVIWLQTNRDLWKE